MLTAAAFLFILIYLVPGFFSAMFFKGKTKNHPFFWLLLSLLVVPIFYTALISLRILSLESFLILTVLYAIACLWIGGKREIDFDKIFPPRKTSCIILLVAAMFFLLVMAPRLGLLKGRFPGGDDFRQIPKVISIAVSPNEPLFPYFPITRLTVYYFANIAPGLLVRFSDNLIQAHTAWFIQTALLTAVMLWSIIKAGQTLFKATTSRFVFFFSLTFFSGWEYYLYKLLNPGHLDQLEWWTDWIFPQRKIHLQTTNPYNLFFWVPQHLFAAVLVLLMFLILRSNQKDKLTTKVFLGLLWANILGISAFVFLSTAAVYAISTIVKVIKTRNFRQTFISNLPIVTTALVLSLKTIELFLTAEKGSHFLQMASVFHFLPNATLVGKLVNFSLTVPFYFLIELGVLLPVLLWALYQFISNKNFRQKYLFFYLFIFLWPLIFVVKTTGDNNIALRTFIPAQIAISIFAAELTERHQKRKLFYPLLITGIIISLPSGLWDFNQHFKGQLDSLNNKRESRYQKIDDDLPLNSVVISFDDEAERITVLGHRLTFKPPAQFTFTDREYSAQSALEPYADLDFSRKEDILKVLGANPQLSKTFNLYILEAEDE